MLIGVNTCQKALKVHRSNVKLCKCILLYFFVHNRNNNNNNINKLFVIFIITPCKLE